MPKVRLQKELENIKRESEAAFQIREEFVRWDNVKTAHDLVDDMEVARMLLDCYDLIGGNFLVWSDQAKLAPPPLHATLFLQHVSEEGWEVLQEIKALGGWRQDKDKDKTEPEQRKSKRKQARVRHIEPVQVKQEVVDPEDGEDRDSQDDDYVPSGDDDDDFVPEEEDIQPKRLTKMIRKPKSRPDRGKKATKKKVAQVEAQESDDDATEDEEKDEEEETSPQPAQRKRGRPKKREVRPPPPPRKSKKKKPKPEEQETHEDPTAPEVQPSVTGTDEKDSKTLEPKPRRRWKRNKMNLNYMYRQTNRTATLFQCKQCSTMCESFGELQIHYETHAESKENAGTKPALGDTTLYTVMYRCKPCDMLLAESEIKYHRKKHKEMIHKVCDICGKAFTVRVTWHKHLNMHEAERTGYRYVCKICGKKFHLLQSLKRHMKYHSTERPHVCEVCGKSFKTTSALKRHRRIHVTTKPYICKFCGKGFTQQYNLKGHERMHTGEKPFKCNLCSAAFAHNGTLTCHKKTAHGIDVSKDDTFLEFDEINVRDPKLYEHVQITSATGASTISSQDEKLQKTSTKKTDQGRIPQTKSSLQTHIEVDVSLASHPVTPAPVEKMLPNLPPDTSDMVPRGSLTTSAASALDGTPSDSLTSIRSQNPGNHATVDAGQVYTDL
ncbi:uncharacterized protein [Amphiura filiformis]|uniref:uncharacterized protein isoform X9 n=1 Tax=Amphiura filiformis TaxID=82378 RepID=UPI003B20B624